MKNGDIVFSFMFGMGNDGFARTRKTENPYNILAPIFKIVSFLTPMTRGKTISIGRSPSQGQSSLFKFPKIAHPQNGCTIMFGIKESKSQGMLLMLPVGVREDINVAFCFKDSGPFIHFNKMLVNGLEVEQPVVKNVLVPLRDQQMGPYHEIFVQSNICLGMVHLFKPGVIDSLS